MARAGYIFYQRGQRLSTRDDGSPKPHEHIRGRAAPIRQQLAGAHFWWVYLSIHRPQLSSMGTRGEHLLIEHVLARALCTEPQLHCLSWGYALAPRTCTKLRRFPPPSSCRRSPAASDYSAPEPHPEGPQGRVLAPSGAPPQGHLPPSLCLSQSLGFPFFPQLVPLAPWH